MAALTPNLALSFVMGLLCQSVFLLLCCFSSEAWSVTFDPMLPLLLLFGGSIVPGRHFESTIVPYWWLPKLHYENTIIRYQLPLRFRLRTWLRLPRIHLHKLFQFFTKWLSLFNEYIHTYIHTLLAFNTLMRGWAHSGPIASYATEITLWLWSNYVEGSCANYFWVNPI